MEMSPFPLHGPVDPGRLIGRSDIVARLVQQVTERRPTVLIGPRRFGKTSVLRAVASDLRPETTVVEVDLYELRSWADLAIRLDTALAAVSGPRRVELDRLAAGLEVNLGVLKATFSSPARPAADLTADRLLDVLVGMAKRTSVLAVFDEFSSIARLDGAAGLLRTKFQHHYNDLGLLFAGSEPSTMRMLFSSADQPFYSQADLIAIDGLDPAAFAEAVEEGFHGSPPAGLAPAINLFAKGHPQRSMQLADAAWRAVMAGIDESQAWEWGLDEVRRSAADGFELRFAGATPGEQGVMRLAASGGALHGRDAEVLALSSSSADHAKRALVANGQLVVDDQGSIALSDPLYADWIRRRFG